MDRGPASRRAAVVAPSLAALTATVASLVHTRGGILIDPDSTAYLWTSRLVRSDITRIIELPTDTSLSIRGLFPPLYTLVLAAVGSLGDDLATARILGAVLAGVSAALVVTYVQRHTTPIVGAVTTVAAFITRGTLLVLFGFLMSDGLHAALLLGTATAVERIANRTAATKPRQWLVIATVLAAACFATRFAAIGSVAGLVVTLGVFGPHDRSRRLAITTVVGIAALLPVALWTAATASSGPVGRRRLGFHRIADFELTDQIPTWFLPRPVMDILGTPALRMIGLGTVALCVVWSIACLRRLHDSASARATGVLIIFGWCSIGAVVASRLFIDRTIPLSGRYSMPFITCMVGAVGIDVFRRLTTTSRTRQPFAIASVATLMITMMLPFARSLSDPVESWHSLEQAGRSPMADQLGSAAPELIVFSNREDLVYLQTGRRTKRLPELIDPYTGGELEEYPEEISRMTGAVKSGRAIVVQYTADAGGVAPIDQLIAATGLRVLEQTDEGAIIGMPGQLPR